MSDNVLELIGVCKQFGSPQNTTQVLRGVNFQLKHGERHALIGPNGAGKTSLFNIISGHLSADNGVVRMYLSHLQSGGYVDITHKKTYEIARLGLSRSFQLTQIFNHLSVLDNLKCAALWHTGYRYSIWRRFKGLDDINLMVHTRLKQLNLYHRQDDLAGHLTYAEQRTLDLGIATMSNSPILLLDEPTAGMSRNDTGVMIHLIKQLTQDKTLLMIEHDMQVIFEVADRISVLVDGQIIACDTPHNIKLNPAVQAAYLG